MRDELDIQYFSHINKIEEGDPKLVEIMNWMMYYVSREDKIALLTEYKEVFDKLLLVFWEEIVKDWFEAIIFDAPLMLLVADMYITNDTLDGMIALKLTWKEAVEKYRADVDWD